MKKKDIKYFQEFLTSRLEELLSHADDTVKKIFLIRQTVLHLNLTGISCLE